MDDRSASMPRNVFALEARFGDRLEEDVRAFFQDGSDDGKTLRANRAAFDLFEIRARRLVDVSRVNTGIELLGESHPTPLMLAPVGFQQFLHPDGELATARAASARGVRMVASTVSSYPIEAIAKASGEPVWFQLYTTPNRTTTADLVRRAEAAGCPAVAVTVDTPEVGNRETHDAFLQRTLADPKKVMGNFAATGLPPEGLTDPTLTWDIIPWLRERTRMKIVLKGIVTREDAALSVAHGADAVIVSNHGGRQEESGRGTIECLPEVLEGVEGRLPVLVDGGFRRGTDVFKALALGARAVLIGRPYIWGLGVSGQAGVEQAIDVLQRELVLAMQLAGTRCLSDITPDYVRRAGSV
jgi:4-hydroxymandelate oxidase